MANGTGRNHPTLDRYAAGRQPCAVELYAALLDEPDDDEGRLLPRPELRRLLALWWSGAI